MKNSFILHIENGKVVNRKVVSNGFNLKDGRYNVEITDYNKRSNPQNNYYWQILTDFIQPGLYDLGWREIKTKDDAHDFMREMFLKVKEVNEISGDERTRIKSTTELSTTEFNVYLEEIAQFAAEFLGVEIPEPNSQLSFL